MKIKIGFNFSMIPLQSLTRTHVLSSHFYYSQWFGQHSGYRLWLVKKNSFQLKLPICPFTKI